MRALVQLNCRREGMCCLWLVAALVGCDASTLARGSFDGGSSDVQLADAAARDSRQGDQAGALDAGPVREAGLLADAALVGDASSASDAARPDTTSTDECDSTAECRAVWGAAATDCVDSQSEQSYYQCGAVRCSQSGADSGVVDSSRPDSGAAGPAGVYIEVESISPVSPWVEETLYSGYSGSSYFRWPDVATNQHGITADQNAALVYPFVVAIGGVYLFEVRGRRDYEGWCTGAPNDACNDIWAKIDDGLWTKKMIKGAWGTWIWDGKWEPDHVVITTEVSLTPGSHSYSLAGRSNGVKIDAIRIYLKGSPPPQP